MWGEGFFGIRVLARKVTLDETFFITMTSSFFNPLSMFVLLKGATKEQSFKIGQEIAEAVTATNPKPVKLKFEKVREYISTSNHI